MGGSRVDGMRVAVVWLGSNFFFFFLFVFFLGRIVDWTNAARSTDVGRDEGSTGTAARATTTTVEVSEDGDDFAQ